MQAALERVLDATGRHSLGNDFDTTELADLLDPSSVSRSLIAIFSEQRRPAFAKERRKHFEKVAKMAGELHELLSNIRFPALTHISALPGVAAFPACESEGDPRDEVTPLASYLGMTNGLARLRDQLTVFVLLHWDEPLINSGGFSQTEMLITGPVRKSFNTLIGRKRDAPARRSRDAETGAAGGPFVRYAVALMKELGSEISPETVMAAISKKAAVHGNGGRSGGK